METFRGKCFFSFFPHHFKRNQNSFQEKKKRKQKQTNKCYFLIFVALFRVFSSSFWLAAPTLCHHRKA